MDSRLIQGIVLLADIQKAKDAKLGGSKLKPEELAAFKHAKADAICAPENGQVIWEISVEGPSSAPNVGRTYKEGELMCHIATRWGQMTPVYAGFAGRLAEVTPQGSTVMKGDAVAYIERT